MEDEEYIVYLIRTSRDALADIQYWTEAQKIEFTKDFIIDILSQRPKPVSWWCQYVFFQVGLLNPEGSDQEKKRLAAIKRYKEIPDELVHLIYSYMAPLKN